MALAKKIRQHDPETAIAFVSNYDEFVFDGYDVNAIDYILKPLTVAKLKHLIEKVASQTQPKLLALQTAAGLVRVPMAPLIPFPASRHR